MVGLVSLGHPTLSTQYPFLLRHAPNVTASPASKSASVPAREPGQRSLNFAARPLPAGAKTTSAPAPMFMTDPKGKLSAGPTVKVPARTFVSPL